MSKIVDGLTKYLVSGSRDSVASEALRRIAKTVQEKEEASVEDKAAQ